MNNIEIARNNVLQFTSQMNDWGEKMYIYMSLDDDEDFSDSELKLIENLSLEDLNEMYYKTLNKYCTSKDRKYGGKPDSSSSTPKYAGINEETILDVKQVKNNRIELIANSKNIFDTKYMFVLLKKGDEWLIDSLKYEGLKSWTNDFL